RVCEHLALARARAYPAHLTDRLDQLTSDAHQVIYQRREFGLSRLKGLIARDIPRTVRANAMYVWIAAAVFVIPTVVLGLLVYYRPELILSVVDPQTAASFERMYSPDAESIGRVRTASTDWAMFGFYIRHNISIAFQCFAGGLFLCIGSLFFLAFNGAFGGAIAGYLTERGLSATFYSFVVTHAAFELTAIVLAGAAGLRIGHSLLAPGRSTRRQSLVKAANEAIIIVYGAAAMLFIAAAIEAFWSSAAWIPPVMKYSVAAVCWIAVLGYLTLQGRRAG
ncbi:MAG TPA: stage II sporulation protein M, partial [Povalibacter sp.]|nr:stage II sporulation protein M [Povalibacter sp.]